MNDAMLQNLRDLIQEDVGKRGLATEHAANLVTTCADDFAAACRSIAACPQPAVGVVTGSMLSRMPCQRCNSLPRNCGSVRARFTCSSTNPSYASAASTT